MKQILSVMAADVILISVVFAYVFLQDSVAGILNSWKAGAVAPMD